jgi:regulator of RNase E activity RraA
VIDGLVRDVRRMIEDRFPVFARGSTPADSVGRSTITSYGAPVRCGGVWVEPGDLIYGDLDGVLAIPATLAPKAVEYAYQKNQTEDIVRKELREGHRLATVYERYRVL